MLTFYVAYVIRFKSLILVLLNTKLFFRSLCSCSFATILRLPLLLYRLQHRRREIEEKTSNCMNIDAFNDLAMVIGFGAWFYYVHWTIFLYHSVCTAYYRYNWILLIDYYLHFGAVCIRQSLQVDVCVALVRSSASLHFGEPNNSRFFHFNLKIHFNELLFDVHEIREAQKSWRLCMYCYICSPV